MRTSRPTADPSNWADSVKAVSDSIVVDLDPILDAQDLRVTLDPGEYELICTVVEEYEGRAVSHANEGMRTAITVRAAAGR